MDQLAGTIDSKATHVLGSGSLSLFLLHLYLPLLLSISLSMDPPSVEKLGRLECRALHDQNCDTTRIRTV